MKCENCEKELNRHIFCSDNCRMRFVRKANEEDDSVRETNKEVEVVRKADDSESENKMCEIHQRVGCDKPLCL